MDGMQADGPWHVPALQSMEASCEVLGTLNLDSLQNSEQSLGTHG